MKVQKKSGYAKLLQVMRISMIQLTMALTCCGLSLAATNYAQLLDRSISITLSEVSFMEALKEIEVRANISFVYSVDQLSEETPVTLQVTEKPLREILDLLLTPRHITYKVYEKDATLSLKKQQQEKQPQPKAREKANTQTQDDWLEVHGTVTDAATQQPMPGVNVLIKGTTNGTTTDANGQYRILADDKDVLIFSFIGYAPQESQVNGRTVIDVVMFEDVTSLREVVINAGYWQVKDQERTGNISRIDAEVIGNQPVNNPLQAMQGRMPGVYIQQNSGVPGGGFKIQIRGENSLRKDGNDPLYVIDGVPFTATPLTSATISGSIIKEGNPLASINPNDIESIEVLKDGDATAIYGSRGANGVVLITTKRGKEGKTNVEARITQGFGKVPKFMDVLNTSEYVNMRIEGMKNDNSWPLPVFLQSFEYDIFAWDTTRQTNWQKELIGGTAHTTNAQLSVSGGTAQTQFLISSAYYKETTVFPGDFDFQRLSGNVNMNHTSLNNKFNTSITVGYYVTFNNLLSRDLTYTALTLPPHAPALYNPDGSLNWDWKNNFTQNPLLYTKLKYQGNTDNLLANGVFRYEIIPGLNIKANLGFNTMYSDETTLSPLGAIPPQFLTNQTASATFGNSNLKTWIVEPQASYAKEMGKGKFNIIVGTTFQSSKQEGETLNATGYTSDALLENINAATSINVLGANYSQYRYGAVFGRINYNLQDKYIVNLTGRRDGSSRFGPGKQFGNFGAIGAAWLFSNEGFMQNFREIVSMGKLRMSYGVTGSDAIGNYQYLDTYSATTYPYNNSTGLIVTRLDNPDYSWETTYKFEVGLETGLWKDHVNVSVSWYNNRATNQLVGLPLPVLSGQPSVQYNLPATVQNTGWEIQVATTNIQNNNFTWRSGFNITLPKNKLLEFPGLEGFPAYNNQYKVGESIFTKKTLRATGVNEQTGLYTFEDVNGDGNIALASDGLFLKEVAQQFFGGVNNQLKYRNFQFEIFLQFVKQTGYNYKSIFSFPGAISNQPTDVNDRWQEAGQITDIQRFGYSATARTAYNRQASSDNAISDASFIRVKNISIAWSQPFEWMNKTKLRDISIFLQGQNVLTFTNYLGMDPENQNINFLPPLRIISIGMQIGF